MRLDKQFMQTLETVKKARYPYIWVVTPEETRCMEMISTVAEKKGQKCFVWDDYVSWKKIKSWLIGTDGGSYNVPEVLNADSLLSSFQNLDDYDEEEYGETIFVYPDFHLAFNRIDPPPDLIIRRLKWIAPKLAEKGLLLIFISHSSLIPNELQDLVFVQDVTRPKKEELYDQLEKTLSDTADINKPTEEIKEQVVRASLGLSRNQANRLYAKAIVSYPKNPENWVNNVAYGKKEIIGSMEALDYYSPEELRDDLGGVEVLKKWLGLRKRAFTKEAEEYKLPLPKGVGLIGIPGTGKSLTAKFIASKWHLPLIRFDIGAVFGSYVGQSEETMRNALNLAETIAPCVLWIDEIEKVFPKDASGGDSGTSTRVLASFLTWMQEKRAPVFVVATANDVTRLPPELLRKGRFDEIFFLDIPSDKEKQEIFDVHIKRVGRDPRIFDIRRLAKKAKNFVGAEIEEVVKSGLYLAFNENQREPTDADFMKSIENTYPLFETRKNDLTQIRGLVERKEVLNASDVSEEKRKEDAPAKRPKLDTQG